MALTIERIRRARERIAPYIVETPLLRLPNLDHFLGCQVYVKAECMQITGAFKLRGAMNKALSLTRQELERGLVTASSGNHGKGVAYAAKQLGTKATVVMPNTAPRVKVEAVRALGAEVIPCEPAERLRIAAELFKGARNCDEVRVCLIPHALVKRIVFFIERINVNKKVVGFRRTGKNLQTVIVHFSAEAV